MLLAIDVGNSEVCFGIFDLNNKDQIMMPIERGRFSTSDFRYDINRNKMLKVSLDNQLSQLNKVTNILISCVAPLILSDLKNFCDKILKCPTLVMGETGVSYPSQALVDSPGEVGADLRVSGFAAHTFYQGPLIVIGFGTATTFSVINDQGDFCGTVIAPGVGIVSQALPRMATHLPQIAFKKPVSPLGLNTTCAMESGLFWGYIGLVEGILLQLQQQNYLNIRQDSDKIKSLKIITTGGYAHLVAPHCAGITEIDSDLTLKGLALIFKTTLKGT
ncbi:MAG: type III pantothenate kinase [Janthinobacterium lividum]